MIFTITLLIECIIMFFLNIIKLETFLDVIAILFDFFLIIAFTTDIVRNFILKKHIKALIIGAILRILFFIWDFIGRNIYILPCSGNDTEVFYYNAVSYVSGQNIRSNSFITLVGTFYKIVGTSRIFSQFLLLMFSLIAIAYIAKSLEYIDVTEESKKKCILLISVLPNFAIESAVFLRESLVIMLVSISLYLFVRWFKEKRKMHYLWSIIFSVFAGIIHSGIIAMTIGLLAIRLLYDRENEKISLKSKNIFSSLFLIFFFFTFYFLFKDTLFDKISGITSISQISDNVSRGDSSYAQYVGDSSSIGNIVVYTLPCAFYFLFSPLPWQWRGISDILAFAMGSTFYIAVIIRIISFFKNKIYKNRNLLLCLSIIAICVLFVYSWGCNNTGTAIRHREKVIALYAIMLCITNNRIDKEKTKEVLCQVNH